MKVKILILFLLALAIPPLVYGEEFDEHYDPASGNSGDYYLGENDSIIVIYEYANWNGYWCNISWFEISPHLKEKYIDTCIAKFIFRDYVWQSWVGERWAIMSEAAECSGEQGKYYSYGDYLYKKKGEIDSIYSDIGVLKNYLKQYASNLGLNTTQFDYCLDSGNYTSEVWNDKQHPVSGGTPSFVIQYDGIPPKLIYGNPPYTGPYYEDFAYLDSQIKDLLNEQNITIATDDMYINSNTTLYSHKYKLKDTDNSGVIIINSSNVVFDCNSSTITGNVTGYGIYINGFENVTIKNCVIENYTYGIYINNSGNILMENNKLKYNSIGIYSENSSSTITSNIVCYNYEFDLFSTNNWSLGQGDSNTCYKHNGWSDFCVMSGCSQPCEMICFDNDGDGFNRTTLECPIGTDCNDDNPDVVPAVDDLNVNRSLTLCTGFYNNVSIIINSSDVVFDCNGSTIRGNGTGYGIYVEGFDNVTIKNCAIKNFTNGIHLDSSSNNILTSNTANYNNYGIRLFSSLNNTLTSNTVNNNTLYGINLHSSSNNTLTSNTANGNTYYGIRLDYSSNNTLTSNTINNNEYGLYLWSSSNNNTLTSNTANNNTNNGIYLQDSSNNNTLTSNTANNNTNNGIYLYSSTNNTLDNNTIQLNSRGIWLFSSSNNTITNNNANLNIGGGIVLSSYSNYNTLTDNNANSNEGGIYSAHSSNNTLTNNTANYNNDYGIRLISSSNNTITNNTADNNKNCGIRLEVNSDFNNLIDNTMTNNTNTGVYFDSNANNNTLTENFICGNALDVNDSDSNSGDGNACETGNWNDDGTTGCTNYCYRHPCDLNRDRIYIHDWNDLMFAYKCFLGINKDCEIIKYKDWDLIKQEYQCFFNTQ